MKDNHTVHNTGAVDKYFKKLLSIMRSYFLVGLFYRGETVISLSSASNLPPVNSLNAEIGQI